MTTRKQRAGTRTSGHLVMPAITPRTLYEYNIPASQTHWILVFSRRHTRRPSAGPGTLVSSRCSHMHCVPHACSSGPPHTQCPARSACARGGMM